MTDPDGATTSYAYNLLGELIGKTDPLGRTTTYTYDPTGNRLTETDPAGDVTTWAYDAVGRVTSKTTPLGETTTTSYDPDGEKISVTDPDGYTTKYGYDAIGELTSVTDALGGMTSYKYDQDGDLISKTDARGDTTTYTYDALNRKISETTPLGETTRFAYDAVGNETSKTDARGLTTYYAYDSLNRRVAESYQNTSLGYTEYQLTGSSGMLTDKYLVSSLPAGAQVQVMSWVFTVGNTAFGPGSGDYLQDIEYPSMAGGTNNNYWLGTPDLSNLTVTNEVPAEQTITLKDLTNHESQSWTFAAGDPHDDIGDTNVAGAIGDQVEIDMYLDNTGSSTVNYALYEGSSTVFNFSTLSGSSVLGVYVLPSVKYGGGNGTLTVPQYHPITYAYDPNGNLTSVTDSRGTTTYTYDSLNRLLTETEPEGSTSGKIQMLTYGYDPDGNRTSLTVTDSVYGQSVWSDQITYTYDSAGQLTSEADASGTTSFQYNSVGERTSMSQPGDTVTTYGYDADGQLTSEEIAYGGGTQAQYSYTYDADGNRLSETTPQGTYQYAYDALGRLTSVTNPSGSTQGYTYDADGNRVSLSAGGQTTTYAYNADSELTSQADGSGSSTYSYDQDGNQTGVSGPAGTSTYQYNGLDQMTEADLPGGTVVQQGYGGTGQLAWSNSAVNGTVTSSVYYVYDGSYVIGTFGSDGDLQSFYLRDPGGLPLSTLQQGTSGQAAYYYSTDALGSVVGLSDPNGAMDGTYAYDAFGNLISSTGPGGTGSPPTWQDLLYAGEYYNQDLGLYALGQRLYDPTVGRFTTADTYPGTLTDPGSENGYVYVEDDPILWVDPTGMYYCAGSIAQQVRFGNINFCPVNGSPQELEGWLLGVGTAVVVGAGAVLLTPSAAVTTVTVGGGGSQEAVEIEEDAEAGLSSDEIDFAVSNQSRLQHAFTHATDLGFGNWNASAAAEWRSYIANILGSYTESFSNMLGEYNVTGYYKVANGNPVAVYVYNDGPYKGLVATVVKLSAAQLVKFGLK